jgi:hypothetical protein
MAMAMATLRRLSTTNLRRHHGILCHSKGSMDRGDTRKLIRHILEKACFRADGWTCANFSNTTSQMSAQATHEQ